MHKLLASYMHPPRGKRVGEVDDNRTIRITVVLRPRTPVRAEAYAGGKELSPAEYEKRHGTPQAVLDQVAALARAHGLHVVETSRAKHVVRLQGTYGQARAAFQPEELGLYEIGGRAIAARSGHLFVPDALANHIVAVMGFDERPVARPHFRVYPRAAATADAWDPAQVARHYRFPRGVDGSGQAIALVELGGGYDPDDIASYFADKGIHRTGRLISVGVDGAENAPDQDPNGPDGEVQLDIDIAGSVAPGADIVVYFGVNQMGGLLDVVRAAIDDRTNRPSVLSLSWGAAESEFARQDLDAIDQAMQSAAALGITICVASGDSGAQDNVPDGGLHVNFPASSPYVLGCGGTRLPHNGPEVAWNDGAEGGASGGGFSAVFAKPAWQTGVDNSMRGVPDVAGDADPATGYDVQVDGVAAVIGGTSAVAPLFAGLVTLLQQSLGHRLGFINPVLYLHPDAFTDITVGNNNGYKAGPGWDPVTGLGSPIGTALPAALRSAAPDAGGSPSEREGE